MYRYLQKVISKKLEKTPFFLLAFWKPLTKKSWLRIRIRAKMSRIRGSGSVPRCPGSADPDPYQNITDPQHWQQPCLFGTVHPSDFGDFGTVHTSEGGVRIRRRLHCGALAGAGEEGGVPTLSTDTRLSCRSRHPDEPCIVSRDWLT